MTKPINWIDLIMIGNPCNASLYHTSYNWNN